MIRHSLIFATGLQKKDRNFAAENNKKKKIWNIIIMNIITMSIIMNITMS